MTRSLVIFLHGVHASGDDLAPLARIFGQFLPNADFVSPDAPERTPVGYQWFDLDGVTPQNRAQRVIDARAKFDALLTKICEAHGAKGAYDRIGLVGFSQGSIMTYDALASGRWPVAAAVAFSGRYAPIPDEKPVKTPLLIIHGAEDQVIPWSDSEAAALALKQLGARIEFEIEPGLGHGISPAGAASAAGFLARHLNPAKN